MNFIYSDEAKNILIRVPIAVSIVIPIQVKEVYGKSYKETAFYDVKDTIENVTFLENNELVIISDYLFSACKKIKSINLSTCTKLKTISNYAFSTSYIETIILPNNTLTSIGEYAFDSCIKLKSFYFPASVTSIGARLLSHCCELETVIFDPDSKLTEITWGAFYGPNKLREITLPKNITYIQNIFIGVKMLINVHVDEMNSVLCSVDGIVYSKDMQTIKYFPSGRTGSYCVNNTVTKIDSFAFMSSQLSEVILPPMLEQIYSYSFANSKISNIDVPSTCVFYDYSAFSGTKLVEFIFPETVNRIGDRLFCSCLNLKRVTMPIHYNSLGSGVFTNCNNIELIYEPTSDFKIDDQGFVYNKAKNQIILYTGNSTKLTIGKSVVFLGTSLFENNYYLKEIEFEPGSKLNAIGYDTFRNCTIERIVLPYSVEVINSRAFYSSKIKTVILSENLKYIQNEVFHMCLLLENV